MLNSTRTRLILAGVALCAVALFAFVGCPDGSSPIDIDRDGDLLIDIDTIDELNAMRYNLDGTSYRASEGGTELLCGTDGTTACIGYELTRDLDFANKAHYVSGTLNPAWRPDNTADPDSATNAGWEPIGNCNTDANSDGLPCGDTDDTPFAAHFDGNGFTIANLYARAGGEVGLFGTNSGTVQGIGIVDARLYGGDEIDNIGGLIGWNTPSGAITASYATGGGVDGGGENDRVGSLIGVNFAIITTSYATGNVDGGDGSDRVGGLIGWNTATSAITASYATGSVNGGRGGDFVGGLVGFNGASATITASYATGNVDGGVGSGDRVGGLLGRNDGVITAIYAIGNVDGGDGDDDRVGGLVGENQNASSSSTTTSAIITASYATGNVDGGVGSGDRVGALSSIGTPRSTASYGFGMRARAEDIALGVMKSSDASDAMVVADACDITQANSSTLIANRWIAAHWDFGTGTQRPLVRHNDAIVAGQTDPRDC